MGTVDGDVRQYRDRHGVQIVYDTYRAAETKAVIQLCHGVGEHARRYGALIDALVNAGYTVYADDHRGHGRTGMTQHGDATKLGRLGPGGHTAAVTALAQLSAHIRSENPGVPVVLMGHSWGSFLAQILVNKHPHDYDGLILSGSALRTLGGINSGALNAPWKSPDAMGTEWLSTDLSVGRAFLDDPLTTTTPLLTLFGPINALRMLGLPRKNLPHDIPVLILSGSEDTVPSSTSIDKLARAYRDRSGLSDVTTVIYPGARHEVFNEYQQETVRADVLNWLDTRFFERRD